MKNKIVVARSIINKYLHNTLFKVLISFFLLFLGGGIYLGWRSGNLVMFQLLRAWGMSDFLGFIRSITIRYPLFEWIKYSMPDGLWLLSYMLLIDAIWYNQGNILYYIFLWYIPILAILSELFQYISIVPGVFDVMDLFCYILAIVIFIVVKFV